MKLRILFFFVAVSGILSFRSSDPIIDKLGLDSATAQLYVITNFTGSFSADYDVRENFISLPRLKALKSIVEGDKKGAALELCAYIRKYVNSEEFLARYQTKREESKPTYEPPRPDESVMQSMRESVRDMEATLAELKQSPRDNAQTIAMFEPMLADQRAVLAEYEDPTPNKTKWERNYPADPAVLVKRKLEEYLQLAESVDFNAQLTAPDAYNIRKFVNPEYESKPPQWKACYRAGKEVNDAVKAYVRDWLKGDIMSATKTRMADAGPVQTGTNASESKAAETPSALAGSGSSSPDSGSTGDSLITATKPKKSLLSRIKNTAKEVIRD